jgi:hypothetical protein
VTSVDRLQSCLKLNGKNDFCILSVLFGLSFVFVPDLIYVFLGCATSVQLAAIAFGLLSRCVTLTIRRSPVGWVNLSHKVTLKFTPWESLRAKFLLSVDLSWSSAPAESWPVSHRTVQIQCTEFGVLLPNLKFLSFPIAASDFGFFR